MSFPSYTFLMLLLLSPHSCIARHLALFSDETGNPIRFLTEDVHDPADVVDKVSTSVIELSASKDFSQEKQETTQGYKTQLIKFSSARTLLVSQTDDAVKAMNSKENEAAEDIVMMDYAQPHRKPPIHNEKP